MPCNLNLSQNRYFDHEICLFDGHFRKCPASDALHQNSIAQRFFIYIHSLGVFILLMNIQGISINFIANLWSVLIIQLELFVRFIERLDMLKRIQKLGKSSEWMKEREIISIRKYFHLTNRHWDCGIHKIIMNVDQLQFDISKMDPAEIAQ